jgi:hypothetical protein
MPSQNTVLIEYMVKAAISTMLILLFWRRRLDRRFPAMGTYLVLHALLVPVTVYLSWRGMQPDYNTTLIPTFSLILSGAIYIADAVLLYFVCTEVFRSVLAPYSGLLKVGVVVFRWVALVSGLLGISSISFGLTSLASLSHWAQIVPGIIFGLTRSVSILELCLLIFLCLSMNMLHLSVGDTAFGICLGFGMLSASEFVQALLDTLLPTQIGTVHFVGEVLTLLVMGIWAIYFALPERVRKTATVPVNSTIYRWNEIASALGYTGTKVVVQQPAQGFFLSDVERVVEMVIARNIKNKDSESSHL